MAGSVPTMLVTAYDGGNPFDVVLDNSGPTNQVLYEGTAFPGTLISASRWRIRKFFFDGNNQVMGWRWADATTDFTKEWDERANYTYTALS